MAKHFNILTYIFVLLVTSFSCRDNGATKFNRKGRFNEKGLEHGRWEYLDAKGNVFQEGRFVNGLRVGNWFYTDTERDSIFWRVHKSPNGVIEMNFPGNLNLVEDSDSLIVFKPFNHKELFALVIGRSSGMSFDAYQKGARQDLINRNAILIDSSSEFIRTDIGKKYLYNYFFGEDSTSRFNIFNIAGLDSDGYLIEVTLRCEAKFEKLGRRVFFSVIPALFINQSKFFSIDNEITEFKD